MVQPEDDFTRVEPNLVLKERAVLGQVIVEVAAVHQVQDETQLVGRLERVRHAHNERAALLSIHTRLTALSPELPG